MREENNRENNNAPRRVSRHSGSGRYGAGDDGKRESIRGFETNGDSAAENTSPGAKNAASEPAGENTARREKGNDTRTDTREENTQNGAGGTARTGGSEPESGGTPKKAPRHPAPPKPYRPAGDPDRFVHQIIPYVMFWVALFAAVSFILRDLCGMGESAGAFGNKFADLLCGLFGAAAYLLPLFLVVLALRWKRFVENGLLVRKLVLSGAFLWLLSGIIHVFEDKTGRGVRVTEAAVLYADGKARAGGGIVGGFLGEWMGFTLRLPGTCLLAIPLLIVVGIYLVGLTPRGLWQRISRKLHLEEKRRGQKAGNRVSAAKASAQSVPAGGTPAGSISGGSADNLPVEDDGWCEPQPLTRSETPLRYEFEEEGKRQPFHTAKHKQTPGGARTVSEELASVFGAENVMDIPEDEEELPEGGQAMSGVRAADGAIAGYDIANGDASETAGTERKPSTAYSPFFPASEQPGGTGYPVGGTPAKATPVSPSPAGSVSGTAQTASGTESARTPEEQTNGFSPFSLPRTEEPKSRYTGAESGEKNSAQPHATAGTPAGESIPPEGYSPFGIHRNIPSEPAGKAGHTVPSTGYSPFGIRQSIPESPAPAKEPDEAKNTGGAPSGTPGDPPVNGFSPFGIHQNYAEGSIGNAGGQGAFGKADYGRKAAFPEEEEPETEVVSDDEFGDNELYAGGSAVKTEPADRVPPRSAEPDFEEDFGRGGAQPARENVPADPFRPDNGRKNDRTPDGKTGFSLADNDIAQADNPAPFGTGRTGNADNPAPFGTGRTGNADSSAPFGTGRTENADNPAPFGAEEIEDEDDGIPDEISFARPAAPAPAREGVSAAFRTATRATVTGAAERVADPVRAYGTDSLRGAAAPAAPENDGTAPRKGDFAAGGTVRATAEPVREPAREPVRAKAEPVRQEPPARTPAPARDFVLPPLTLLNEDHQNKNVDHTEEMAEKKEALRATLASFNVRIQEDIQCSRGPTITRYELRPEVGTSVRSVTNHIDDISLNMAAQVRIEAPIPGKPAIGIEVPNADRETVYMRTLLEAEEYRKSDKPLEVPLGIGIGGNIQMCDLAKMPHLLIAGTTGSGKSVCINTILIGLMYKTTPADLRLILIDPKQVEFSLYEHIPHLYMPIVTDMKRAVGVLACAVAEMDRRYALMRDVGVREIDSYNEAVKNDPEREHLPKMVIVIDEFADLKMSVTNNDPETFTCRLAQKARAAGIHLIIGTQRPSVDVITGKLKANIPSRIAFTVQQQVDSRTILDTNGAEALTGRGDMLYLPVGVKKPARVQGAFVSDGEIDRVVTYIREHNETVHYNEEFMNQLEVEMARAESANHKSGDDDFADDGDSGEDAIFNKAVRLAVESQKVATSLLQRRLSIGYGRAAKLIDRMEELGIVSPADGNKPRRVLITAEQYAAKMESDGGFSDDPDDFI